MRDRDRKPRPLEVEVEPIHLGDEPAHREQPGGRGTAGRQRQRIRHHRALREASDHGSRPRHAGLLGEGIEPRRERLVCLHERVPVRVADALDDVPVKSARRQRQRPARGRAHQAALGVERVEQREQVRLVHSAAVQQHQRAVGLPGRRADAMGQQTRPSAIPTCSRAPRPRAGPAPARSRAGSRRRGRSAGPPARPAQRRRPGSPGRTHGSRRPRHGRRW